MADTYANYEELSKVEVEGKDYQIIIKDIGSKTLCFTPHGGSIESGTSELIDEISNGFCNQYRFEGIKPTGNSVLHITSTNFDEPQCLELISTSEKTLSIHGASSDVAVTYVGGKDKALRQRVVLCLREGGFDVEESPSNISGESENNIVNRNIIGMGCQLELSSYQRKLFFKNNDFSSANRKNKTETFYNYVKCIKKALTCDVERSIDNKTTVKMNFNKNIKCGKGAIGDIYSTTSEIKQTADSITSTVSDLSGKYTELKQTVDGIDVTGKVSFYDLRTAGATVINGSNITTGTIDTNRVNIKGGTTKKIVIANDNYCVYDGSETDVNRKVFIGFRTNVSTNVPSVMLGYNGINPSVDGAVVSGGTYTTYSHYPNNNNPEDINLSYGALAFKYGAGITQFSTLNMYQNGDIDLKAGKSIYFRPNLRAKDNHVFAITDTSVGSRVPFQCTSTIYSNGDITTDRNIHAYGNISASGSMSCGTILPSNISIGSNLSINSNGVYTTGHITGNMVKTDSYRFTNNHIAFAKSDYNNNMMNGCHWDWQYCNLVNVKVYPVSLSLPTIDEPTIQTVSKTHKDTLSQIKFPEVRELSVEESAPPIDISDVINKEEITTNGDVDLIKLVYLLVKDVQELKQENEELKKLIKGE